MFYVILIPLLAYNMALIVQAVVRPNETPAFLGYKMYVIISGSMQPELEVGDIVVVKKINPNDLKKDDVISFRKGQTIITHRIAEVKNAEEKLQFLTKGDNNNTSDKDLVSEKEVEGIVVNKIQKLGKIVLKLRDKTLIIFIILIYYVFLMYDQSIQKRKNIRRIKREEYEEKKRKESSDEGKKD
jgi:signal peptidase